VKEQALKKGLYLFFFVDKNKKAIVFCFSAKYFLIFLML